MRDFIFPFIFTALMEDQVQHVSPICRRIGFYLLSALLESITDMDMIGCIMKIFLHKKSTDFERKEQQINKSFHLVLLKEKTNVDTILVLNIYHNLMSYILNTNARSLREFYHRYKFILMEMLKINYQSKPFIECLKLKLLILILQPLMQEKSACDSNLAKLKNVFLQNLEILYEELVIKIRQNIYFFPDIINKEYEMFIHTKIDINKIITDQTFFEDEIVIYNMIYTIKLELYNLFCIRLLYLAMKGEKEKCLPLMKKKEEIGKITAIDCSLPCEKFIGGTLYMKDHFVKMTDRQLLVLQSTKNKIDGVIVFNAYYKDIIYSVHENNILKISESSSNESGIISKQFSIRIKFSNTDDLKFVIDAVKGAKETQLKTVKRKLERIFFEKV